MEKKESNEGVESVMKQAIHGEENPENLDVFGSDDDIEDDIDDDAYIDEPSEWDYYGSSGEKYGWYNDYSDDVIDDAFDGCPEATWNVD